MMVSVLESWPISALLVDTSGCSVKVPLSDTAVLRTGRLISLPCYRNGLPNAQS
jgi:hypothetical protein